MIGIGSLDVIKAQGAVFFRFLWRDFYVYVTKKYDSIINGALLHPTMHVLCFGFFFPVVQFGQNATAMTTVIVAGSLMQLLFIVGFMQTVGFLFEMEQSGYTKYQLTMLSPSLILLEKICYGMLVVFCYLLPFFPMAKLLLGGRFVTTMLQPGKLVIILFFGAMVCCAFCVMSYCYLASMRSLTKMWLRVFYPLLVLSGAYMPWSMMNEYSPIFGKIMLFSPFTYISEGIRGSVMESGLYISFSNCITMLGIFTAVFFIAACYFFKKKTDHI